MIRNCSFLSLSLSFLLSFYIYIYLTVPSHHARNNRTNGCMRRLLHSETNGKTFIYPMSGLLKLRGRVNGTQTKGFVDTEREREREDLIMWLWRPKFPSPAGHGLSSRELYTLLSSLYLDELGRSRRRRRRNEREFIKSGGRRSLERERETN